MNNTQSSPIIDSIKTNIYFYIILLICLRFISNTYHISYIKLIITYCIAYFYSYFSHYLAHALNFKKIKKTLKKYNHNINKENPIIKTTLDYCINSIISISSFHKYTHHSKNGNKPKNVVIEFLILIFAYIILPLFIIDFISYLDKRIIILFGLCYATIHTFNYSIPKYSYFHRKHHINTSTNYGIDIMDHLFNTSYDNKIEDYNHYIINIIIVTYIIVKLGTATGTTTGIATATTTTTTTTTATVK